jgi:hypothetical protein
VSIENGETPAQQGPQPIVPVTDTSITANLSVIPPNDNASFAASVMAKLRAAKKPGEFERIALGDVPELCRRLGAR